MNPKTFILLAGGLRHPRSLFHGSDSGTVLVPSSISSVYQDQNGKTAGAVASPVGLVLDDRFGQARGANLETANYTTQATSDNITTSLSPTSFTQTAGTTIPRTYLNFPAEAEAAYEISFTITAISAGTVLFYLRDAVGGGGVVPAIASGLTVGSYRYIAKASTATSSLLWANGTAGTSFSVSSISLRAVPGNHASQGTLAARPTLAAGGKIHFDGVDDALVITWAGALGSACTVGRAVPQGAATILTGQTIGTSYTDTTDNCGLVIINRDLTANETNQLRRWLNQRAAGA